MLFKQRGPPPVLQWPCHDHPNIKKKINHVSRFAAICTFSTLLQKRYIEASCMCNVGVLLVKVINMKNRKWLTGKALSFARLLSFY